MMGLLRYLVCFAFAPYRIICALSALMTRMFWLLSGLLFHPLVQPFLIAGFPVYSGYDFYFNTRPDLGGYLLLNVVWFVIVYLMAVVSHLWLRSARAKELSMMPESSVPGSEYFTAKYPPACQFSIYVTGSKKILFGSGVRIGDYLVTCEHVVRDQSLVYAYKWSGMRDKVLREEWSEHVLSWKLIDSDLVVARMPHGFLQGLKSATVKPLDCVRYAQITSGHQHQNSSTGLLEPSADNIFGMVCYKGSTRPGFSGSAYMVGDCVVGLHAGGGVLNYAFSASYVSSLLNRPEITPTAAIRKALKYARRGDVQVSATGDPDEVQVRVGGRYFWVGHDDLDFLQDDLRPFFEEDDYGDYLPRRRRGNRQDYIQESATGKDEVAEEELADQSSIRRDVEEGELVAQVSTVVSSVAGSVCNQAGNSDSPQEIGGSSSLDLVMDQVIDCQNITTERIQSFLESKWKDMDGLKDQFAKFMTLLESIPNSGNKPLMDMMTSLTTRLERLERSLQPQTLSPSGNLNGTQRVTDLIGGSELCSDPSTSMPVPVLGNSVNTQQSQMHWVGMESDLTALKEWKLSNDSLSNDYLLRRELFRTSRNLTHDQMRILNKNLTSWWKSAKLRKKRASIPIQ